MFRIHNRVEAGRQLAEKLKQYANRNDVIVLALPRGGVPVGYEISKALHLPLDAFLVRKLGVPGHEELAMGAIAMGDVYLFNESILKGLAISEAAIEKIKQEEQEELNRRNNVYRQGRSLPDIKNKIVILVDDGLATGATMRAAVAAIKKQNPAKIIAVVPVSAYDTYLEFQTLVDEIVCLATPEPFYSIGQWYDEFPQLEDEEVCALLNKQTK